MAKVHASTFKFLKDLAKNNERDWFNANKDRYLAEREKFIAFADELLNSMNEIDVIETPSGKKSLYRIYRDTRFSKNKTPYKTAFSGSFTRATKWRRGGYYFHIEPDHNFLGGGFWQPNSEDLLRIRKDIAADDAPLRAIIKDKNFIKTFGVMGGSQLKTAPRNFAKDHPAIDLLRYKQFIVSRSFTNEEVLSADFIDKVVDTFRQMRPFFDYMSDVLTTDENGVPIE